MIRFRWTTNFLLHCKLEFSEAKHFQRGSCLGYLICGYCTDMWVYNLYLYEYIYIYIYIFIHSFIQEFIRRPFKKSTQRRPQPMQPRRYRSVLSNLQNALSLFLGRIRISKGSPCISLHNLSLHNLIEKFLMTFSYPKKFLLSPRIFDDHFKSSTTKCYFCYFCSHISTTT